jgi:hypothetical protein
MQRTTLLLTCLALISQASAEVAYEFVPNFITPPPGKETIGDGHGEIAVDSTGNIYVSVQEAHAGIQVYGKDGKFIKALPLPASLHGFVIRKVAAGEFIFATVLNEQKVIQATLDGKVVMEIPTASFPAEQRDFVTVTKIKAEDVGKPKPRTDEVASGVKLSESQTEITLKLADGKEKVIPKEAGVRAAGGLKLTNCDVATNGDIYVVDGYGKSWIFVFDGTGKFKAVFGGPGEPLKLANAHKIFVDNRFEPARLMICDRGHKRMIHANLDGTLIGEIATEMRNPSSASFHGDLMCVAEIAGNVSVWDKEGKRVADLGTSPQPTNTPGIAPKEWQTGIVTSPHGITFDNEGNILETEWNKWGRVLRWNRK